MVVVIMCEVTAVLVQAAAGSHVGFAANDRFDPEFFRLAIELDRAEHVTVIGYRDGGLAERFDLLNQRIDLIRPVEKAELGVDVEMNELRCHGRADLVPDISQGKATKSTWLVESLITARHTCGSALFWLR